MKKALEIFGRIFTAIVLAFSICVMIFTIVSVNTIGKDADLFGYKPYIVRSDSMQGVFEAGDLTVSKAVDAGTLQPGDIITFKSIDPDNFDEIVTHKIREITEYEGQPAFVTYGIATGVDDSYPVPFDHVVGAYQFRLPKMGYFFEFLKSPAGYFTVILIPFLILIALQAVRFFKLVRLYKEEQQAELDAQRAELNAKTQETQKIMEELEQLKAQLKEKADVQNTNAVQADDTGGDA